MTAACLKGNAGERACGEESYWQKGERDAEWFDGNAEMQAKEGDISYPFEKAVMGKLNSVNRELKKINMSLYSVIESSLLTQKELKRVTGELKEKDVLIESLRGAADAQKPGREGQGRRPSEVTKR